MGANVFFLRYFYDIFWNQFVSFLLFLLFLKIIIKAFSLSLHLSASIIQLFAIYWCKIFLPCRLSYYIVSHINCITTVTIIIHICSGFWSASRFTKINNEILWSSLTISSATSSLFVFKLPLLLLLSNYIQRKVILRCLRFVNRLWRLNWFCRCRL